MPVFTSSTMTIAGNTVDIRGITESPGLIFIRPGASVEVPIAVRKGRININVGALDKDLPSVSEAGGMSFNCVPILIEVSRENAPDLVAAVMTKSGRVPGPRSGAPKGPPAALPGLGQPTVLPGAGHHTIFDLEAGTIDETLPYRREIWTIRLVNTSNRIASVSYAIRYIRDSSLVSGDIIPLSVLRNAFGIVLQALAPAASLHGKRLTLQISPEVAEFIPSIPENGAIALDLDAPIGGHGELISLDVALVPGADARRAVEERWALIDGKLKTQSQFFAGVMRTRNNKWKDDWLGKIGGDDVTVKISVVLSDIEVVLGKLWTETVSLGEIVDASATIYLVLKSHTAFLDEQFGMGHALVFSPVKVDGVLLEIGDVFGAVPDIAGMIEDFAEGIIPQIHRYFAEAMVRLAGSIYTKRYIDARIQGDDLIVRYCDDPADPGAFPRPVPVFHPPPPPPSGGALSNLDPSILGMTIVGAGKKLTAKIGEVEPEPLGVVPAGFDLGSPLSLARLDDVQTIVVVMMENRSFDHMLGRLGRNRPGRGYACYPDDATNSVPGQSPIGMVHARDVQLDAHLALRIDPYHGIEHVLDQINDGRMDGFARDILKKGDPRDRVPQLPLTYYEEADIPFFYYLADNYMVCDHWFAAHPGGTYPNRWALLSGQMPEIKNFEVDDRRMGFIPTPTVFEALTPRGVDWIYYESNLGMLRMYARFRLDDTHVLPFSDRDVGFEARARAGTLPPVVFIEPKITGIPPLSQASDDHPPANLLRGQEFLTGVYRALRASPQWPGTMLVVTYDEHGGFYDHMPPPGTALGDPRFKNGFPLIHPEGKAHLGVRVPAFIVSPLVKPGSVSHEIFDHTSVIKTILARHRMKIPRLDFSLFGERVPVMNHLGQALNLRTPPAEQAATTGLKSLAFAAAPPVAPPVVARAMANFGDVPSPRPTRANLPPEAFVDAEEIPYGVSLARAMMPKR